MKSMDQYLLLRGIKNEDDMHERIQSALLAVIPDNQFKKQQGIQFLNAILSNLEDSTSSPISKFYTLMILKQLTEKKQTTILGLLNGHKLLKKLEQLALTVDPKKNINEKGKDLFPKQKDLGNNYIRLALQCLLEWGTLYQKSRNQQPTKFKKVLINLINNKVVLPTENIFIKQRKSKAGKNQEKLAKKPSEIKTTPKNKQGGQIGLVNQIRFNFIKIESFLGDLENIQDPNQLVKQIIKKHKDFTQYLNKQGTANHNFENISQQNTLKYFAIHEFLNQQKQHYINYAQKNDFISYKTSVQIAFEKYFGHYSEDNKQQLNKQPKQKPKQDTYKQPIKNVKLNQKDDIKKPPSYQPTGQQNLKKQEANKGMKPIPKQQVITYNQPYKPNSKVEKINGQQIMKTILRSKQERQRTSKSGFKIFKQSLEKQKKKVQVHPPKSSVSPGVKNIKLTTSNIGNSAISKVNTIFNHPPNLYPYAKDYEGTLTLQNKDLNKILYQIKNEQGLRKFKLSNFREKSILFQNQDIQIGFKSSAIYQTVDQFESVLSIELFIGNKLNKQIKKFKLQFLGDENTLLYSNPKQMNQTIEQNYQVKHQLIIIPKRIPFNFVNMKISYSNASSTIYSNVIVPFSILKFTTYTKCDKNQLNSRWNNLKILKTQIFPLSQNIAPKSLLKQIPQLIELTDYSKFQREGSNEDYVLSCQVQIMEQYQGLLKINIRPNLKVLIQVGLFIEDSENVQYFKFYLQTLQFLLNSSEL